MKALVLVGKDLPLAYQEVTNPVASNGETLVYLKAAALNHRDIWIQQGQYGGIKYPTILGSDGAGITADGQEVVILPSLDWGDNPTVQAKKFSILGLPRDGTFAEEIAVPSENLFPKPAHLTWEEAAALPLAGLTAYRALFSKCQLEATDKVLITGVGGGVAMVAMQLALAVGCQVYVTSSDDNKIEKAVKIGAAGGINYKKEAWAKELQSQVGGFDVIIDSAAGDGFSDLVRLANPGARISFFGGTRGAINNLNPQMIFWKQISIFGTSMGTNQEFEKMLNFVTKNKIHPIIDSVFPISEGNEACGVMEKGSQFGRIVLKINYAN